MMLTNIRVENNELLFDGQPEIDDKYPGFCCPGFDFIITIVWPARHSLDGISGVGCCLNPNCPDWDGTVDDIRRGVKMWEVEDIALKLRGNDD